MPRLSVVVPVYNVEKYLNQCIDSILEQSFSDFELILVDDGSTDRSGVICDQYAEVDARVTVIHTENRGSVSARRTGVNLAHGQYTSCVDSDDWLDPDYYLCAFDVLGGKNADVVIYQHVIRAAGCVRTTSFHSGYYEQKDLVSAVFPKMMYDMSTEQYHISPSLCMDKIFRTELLRKTYTGVDPRVTLGEDAVCTYPCIARANSVLIVDNAACYHYREGHVSMVNNCDIRLLQRVSALAVNMNQQFSELPDSFNIQVQNYITLVVLNAARQVLLCNRELRLAERIEKVKDFLRNTAITHAAQETLKHTCPFRMKLKLRLATKKQPLLLYMLLQANNIYQKIKYR